jgi:hypothetical protein
VTIQSEFRFEEPPGKRNRTAGMTKHERAANKMRNRPGAWAVIGAYSTVNSSSSMAYAIRKGNLSAYAPAGSFESVSRNVDGEHLVYARYVGQGGEDA